jgi:hypothetical protein
MRLLKFMASFGLALLVPVSCANVLGIKDAELDTNGKGGTSTKVGTGGTVDKGSTGGSSGTSDTCGMSYATDCLQACGDSDCCEESSACADNAMCQPYINCIQACEDDDADCVTGCGTEYPEAVPLLLSIGTCVKGCGCPDTTEQPPTALESAVNSYAEAECKKMDDCSPGWLRQNYDTVEECADRLGKLYQWLSELPGTAWVESAFVDCADAIFGASCADYVNRQITECEPPGDFDNGESCDDGVQCASRVCENPTDACGECVEAPSEGDDCISGSCGHGLVCSDARTCERPRAVDEDCSGGLPCQGKAICYEDVCTQPIKEEGASCDPNTGVFCDSSQKLVCSSDISKCVFTNEYLGDGEGCGVDPEKGTMTGCARGVCSNDANMICIGLGDGGDSCDIAANRYCEWPAYCSSGTCRFYWESESCE